MTAIPTLSYLYLFCTQQDHWTLIWNSYATCMLEWITNCTINQQHVSSNTALSPNTKILKTRRKRITLIVCKPCLWQAMSHFLGDSKILTHPTYLRKPRPESNIYFKSYLGISVCPYICIITSFFKTRFFRKLCMFLLSCIFASLPLPINFVINFCFCLMYFFYT